MTGIAVVLSMIQSQWSPAFHDVPTPFGIACQGEGMPAWLYPNATLETQLVWPLKVKDSSPLAKSQIRIV